MPADISKHVLLIGEYFDEPGHGGISSVLSVYSSLFESFNFIASHRGGSFADKLRYDLGGLFKMIIILAWDSLKSVFGKGEYRIVHIHTAAFGSFRNHVYYASFARLFGRKTVFHIHASMFKGYFNGSGVGRRGKIVRALNKADKVIVLSESWKRWFESIGVRPDMGRLVVLNNIVSKPEGDVAKKREKGEPLKLLFLGEIGHRKGVFDVLEALSLNNSFNGRIIFKIAGCHNEEKLLREIKDKGLSGFVSFEGFVSGQKKIDLLLWADALILTSYNEGLPISVLEAMSFGCAIVSTPVGGIPEVVGKDNGVLVPPGDIKRISDAIEGLCDMPADQFARMGKASREAVSVYYPEAVMAILRGIYMSLLP